MQYKKRVKSAAKLYDKRLTTPKNSHARSITRVSSKRQAISPQAFYPSRSSSLNNSSISTVSKPTNMINHKAMIDLSDIKMPVNRGGGGSGNKVDNIYYPSTLRIVK